MFWSWPYGNILEYLNYFHSALEQREIYIYEGEGMTMSRFLKTRNEIRTVCVPLSNLRGRSVAKLTSDLNH